MKAIPVGGAALSRVVRRTAIVSAVLAVVVGAAALAFNVAARGGEPERPTLLAAGDSVVVVLDLSVSIPEAAYTRMRNALRVLADSDARVGLVIFSDIAYEVLPAGSPATELRPVIHYLTPVPGEINEQTRGPVYAIDPWSNGLILSRTPSSLMWTRRSKPSFLAIASRNSIISLNFQVVST